MQPFKSLTGVAAPLLRDDINTDQVTPTSFLLSLKPDLAHALFGNWRPEHRFALKQALKLYEFYQKQLRECETQIEACLRGMKDKSNGAPLPPNGLSFVLRAFSFWRRPPAFRALKPVPTRPVCTRCPDL